MPFEVIWTIDAIEAPAGLEMSGAGIVQIIRGLSSWRLVGSGRAAACGLRVALNKSLKLN